VWSGTGTLGSSSAGGQLTALRGPQQVPHPGLGDLARPERAGTRDDPGDLIEIAGACCAISSTASSASIRTTGPDVGAYRASTACAIAFIALLAER